MASLQDRACGDHHGTDIHSAAYGGFHARGGGCALKEAVASGEHRLELESIIWRKEPQGGDIMN